MELENRTDFHAALFRGCIDEKRLLASLVVRLTYDLRDDRLVLAGEQTWPVSPGPWPGPHGEMEGDELFYRGGVDLFVFGSARASDGQPASCVDVAVRAGASFATSVRVFGERRWEKRRQRLSISAPEPFEAMPLTVENAYGGADVWDELQVPFPSNPAGKGYATSAESAQGKALPNVEDPDQLIERWEDQPEPVGVCPCPPKCAARVLGRVVFDERNGRLAELKPTFFNHAFPRMIAPFLDPGEVVAVTGVTAGEPIRFALPVAPVRVRVRIGERSDERLPPLDQIGVDADKRQVVLTYRYPFRYVMTPLERRRCELLAESAGAPGRTS